MNSSLRSSARFARRSSHETHSKLTRRFAPRSGFVLALTATGFTTIADLRENRCNDVIDFTDSSGRTALHFASSIGDAISVKMLVKYGASCEKRANDNESALSYAGSRIVRSTLLNSLLSELEDAKFSVSKVRNCEERSDELGMR